MSGYTIPNVIAEHPRGDRIIVLGTVIAPGVANTLTAQLIFLEGQSTDQEINLYINCEGGDIPSMLAIYDTMRYIQAPVVTTCVGQAVAAGAGLLRAGGERPGHDPRPDPGGRRTGPAACPAGVGAVGAHGPVGGDPARRHRQGPHLHRAGGARLRADRPDPHRPLMRRQP